MSQTQKPDTATPCNTNKGVAVSEVDHDFDDLKNDDFKDTGKKYRGWAMTIYDLNDLETFKNDIHRYKVSGREICPESGNTHYQSFIYFDNAQSFKRMIKKYPRSRCRPIYKPPIANATYCKKDKDVVCESGDCPEQGKVKATELKKMTNKEIIELDPRCHKAYINARDLLNYEIDVDEWDKEVEVYYIDGPSGSGKTQTCKEIIRANKNKYGKTFNEVKHKGEYWLGVSDSKICVYDDFRPSHMPASEFINFIDYHTHKMNVKGGCITNNYNLIIITSVVPLENIYNNMEDEEPRQQWMRRIKHIKLDDIYKEPPKVEHFNIASDNEDDFIDKINNIKPRNDDLNITLFM